MSAALAAPIAAVGAAAPVMAVEAETPVMRTFRGWQAAKVSEGAVYAATDDETAQDKAWNARYEVELRLMKEPALTPQDWALKICAWCNFGDGTGPDQREAPQLWAEARALVAEVA
ncbi:hypothetical protein [Paenirhodobacter enshiensis]|uniref:hypothetical protein n=1 Tax=Paenirhodobacter enshiensis TaxID=1105367 RepID=UPI0035AFDC5D